MKRDPSIELWRCFCMLVVVLDHVVGYNGVLSRSAFTWHVPGFFLISGWFGINFRISKVFKLLSTVWICYWLTIPLRGGSESIVSLILPHGGWVLPFYVTLMLVSVIWNAATERRNNDFAILGVIGCLLAAETVSLICQRASMLAIVSGNLRWGFLLLLAVYVPGRIASLRGWGQRSGWIYFAAFVLGIVLLVLSARHWPRLITGAQPLSIVTAYCGFLLFRKFEGRLPKKLENVICFISPSMFSVYLIHECCIPQITHSSFAAMGFGHAVLYALYVFAVCVLIDMVRRFLLWIMKKCGGIFWGLGQKS